MKTRVTEQQHYEIFEHAISNINCLLDKAHLSFTPVIHSTLEHSHMEYCNGIADMLEDDIEHNHQIADKSANVLNSVNLSSTAAGAKLHSRRLCGTTVLYYSMYSLGLEKVA